MLKMDEVIKNAPFGTDFTPTSNWRFVNRQRPGTGILRNPKLSQSFDNQKSTETYYRVDFWKSSHENLSTSPTKYDKQYNLNELEADETSSSDPHNYSKERLVLSGERNGNETTSLETMVNIKLQQQSFDKMKLKEMHKELSFHDPKHTGLVNEKQVKLAALKYELPLRASTLRMLCHKYSVSDSYFPVLVYYEEFLNFLANCFPLPLRKNNNVNAIQTQKQHKKNADTKKALESIMRSYPISDKVVVMLKEQMNGAETWNVEKLYEALLDADRFDDKKLEASVILSICVNQRLPLTKALITKLLKLAEIDHDMVNWREFLAPIICSCAEISPRSKNIPSRWDDNKLPAHLPERYKEVKYSNPIVPTQFIPFGTNSSYRYVDSVNREAAWSRNFAQLSSALKTFNPYKQDLVPRPEVDRMLRNYNVIYELGFSPTFMENALKCAVVDKKLIDFEQTDMVSLDLLLKNLS